VPVRGSEDEIRPGVVGVEIIRVAGRMQDGLRISSGLIRQEIFSDENSGRIFADGAANEPGNKKPIRFVGLLQDGDVLWVPRAPEQKYFAVTGAVSSAGRFEYREGMTLADALALAGQLAEAADPKRVAVIHADGEKETLDILPMLRGEETEIARKPIQPDDIVLVPARDKSYVVLGAVGKPGFFLWDEQMRLADALAKAGGPVERVALMSRVLLVRRTGEGGNPTVLQLDARQLLEGRNEAANWQLMPGDTVYVPAQGERTWRENLTNPWSILGIINTVERIFNW